MSGEPSESVISANGLLLVGMMVVLVAMVSGNIPAPYFAQGSGLLFVSLVSLIGPLIYFFVGCTPGIKVNRRRFWVAVITIIFICGSLTIRQVVLRGATHQPLGIHDGAVQTEIAAQKALDRHNPYGADYRGTNYQTLNPPIPGGPKDNVVWHHFIYPPTTILFESINEAASRLFQSQGDVRVITLGALVVLCLILLGRQKTWTGRTKVLLLTLGNPLLFIYALIGANDIVAVLGIAGTALLAEQRKWRWMGFVFAVTMGVKQSAWLVAPLWVIWMFVQYRSQLMTKKEIQSSITSLVLGLLIVFGPFFLWNAHHLWTDIVVYASGSIPFSYPISGTTLLQYLHVWKVVATPWSITPTYIFQLVVGLPALIFLSRWIRQSPTANRWLIAGTLLTLSVLLVSRYVNANYISGIVGLLVSIYILQQDTDNMAVHV